MQNNIIKKPMMVDVILEPNHYLSGVKLLNGVKDNKFFTSFSIDEKFFYTKKENRMDKNDIHPCESGFHFCSAFKDTLRYKNGINFDHKYAYIRPSFYIVISPGARVMSDCFIKGLYYEVKFVTNAFEFDGIRSLYNMVDDIFSPENRLPFGEIEITNNHKFFLIGYKELYYKQKINNVRLTISPCDNSMTPFNQTIFVDDRYFDLFEHNKHLDIINETNITHYVVIFDQYTQKIISIPRYSSKRILKDTKPIRVIDYLSIYRSLK